MVDRKAQNAVGSSRSAMIFSLEFDAGEAVLVNLPQIQKKNPERWCRLSHKD